jgi:hypothetical protein
MSIDLRYKDIVNNMNDYWFHIIGCGAIGSSAAMQLARMNASHFSLYDPDIVEEHNIGIQQYNYDDVDEPKVDALKKHILSINKKAVVNVHQGKLNEWYAQRGGEKEIAVLGVDSMSARLDCLKVLMMYRKEKVFPELLIDGRMGSEHYQQYSFISPTIRNYMKTWYDDDQGDPEPCSARGTSYCGNMSGSFIVNAIRKYLTKQPMETEISFNFPTMTLAKKVKYS